MLLRARGLPPPPASRGRGRARLRLLAGGGGGGGGRRRRRQAVATAKVGRPAEVPLRGPACSVLITPAGPADHRRRASRPELARSPLELARSPPDLARSQTPLVTLTTLSPRRRPRALDAARGCSCYRAYHHRLRVAAAAPSGGEAEPLLLRDASSRVLASVSRGSTDCGPGRSPALMEVVPRAGGVPPLEPPPASPRSSLDWSASSVVSPLRHSW